MHDGINDSEMGPQVCGFARNMKSNKSGLTVPNLISPQVTSPDLLATIIALGRRDPNHPDSKFQGANMGPNWPDWPQVDPMNLAIRTGSGVYGKWHM